MKKFIFSIFIITGVNISCFAQNKFQHPDGKYVKVHDAKLWIETEGTGDALFLVSGGPGNAHVGMHSFAPLKESCTLVYIDNFGRGKSDAAKNPAEYSISRDVEDIEGLRKALNYDQINLLGHSYGSIVAQAYSIKYPQHVKHLIIANGFFSGEMWQKNDDNCNHEIKQIILKCGNGL